MTCFYCHQDRPVGPFEHHDGISHTCTTVDACRECVAFVIADREDEAAMFNAMALPAFAPETLEVREEIRTVRQVEDLTDRRFGKLTAIRLEVVHRPGRPKRREWLLRCECGAELYASSTRLLKRGEPRACASCAHTARGLLLRGRCPANRVPRSPGVVPHNGRAA